VFLVYLHVFFLIKPLIQLMKQWFILDLLILPTKGMLMPKECWMFLVDAGMSKNQTDASFFSVIPTNIYGPYDNYNLEDSHVIPGLIHKCHIAKQKGEPFIVWGSGKPLRQFIYSEDLGALMVWTLENYQDVSSPLILSVGEQEEVSIADVAKLVAKHMGYTSGLQFDTSKSDGQFKKTASNKKLLSLNPDFKFTTIEDGVKKSVDWFVQNYDKARK